MTKSARRVGRLHTPVVVFAALAIVAGCGSETSMSTTDLSNDDAVQQINAAFTTARIPDTFTPIRGISRTTNWGAEARTVEVAFDAMQADIDAFVAETGAHEHKWLKDTSASCPPTDTPHESVTTTPQDSIIQGWYDRGLFQRCEVVEAWSIPPSELKNSSRSVASIFRQPDTDSHDNPALMKTLITASTA